MASVFWQILTGVQTSVAAVVSNTVLRKKLQVLEQDTLPICVVAPGPAGEKIIEQTMKRGVWWDYPVLVAYVVKSNAVVGLQQSFMDTRESIRNQLFQMAAPVGNPASVFDVNINPQAAVEFQQYLGTNYDVSGFLVTYRSAEQRTS